MSGRMKTVMIGSGNVAWHLVSTLQKTRSNCEFVQVISRSAEHAEKFADEFGIEHFSSDFEDILPEADLVIIAVSDHSISPIAQKLKGITGKNTVIVHTSGSISVDELKPAGENTGVFYPLQTFTRYKAVNFADIPMFLEGNDYVMQRIRPLAEHISDHVRELDSGSRLRLHLGAVFVSNFANFMWLLGEEELPEGAGLEVYEPLIRECVDKLFRLGPRAAMTGPALRNDKVTMDKHLDLLAKSDPQKEKLYKMISDLIAKRYTEKK